MRFLSLYIPRLGFQSKGDFEYCVLHPVLFCIEAFKRHKVNPSVPRDSCSIWECLATGFSFTYSTLSTGDIMNGMMCSNSILQKQPIPHFCHKNNMAMMRNLRYLYRDEHRFEGIVRVFGGYWGFGAAL